MIYIYTQLIIMYDPGPESSRSVFKCLRFSQADFFVGATIEVNASPFQLLWADDAAFSRMENDPKQFPYAVGHDIMSSQ